MKQDFIQIKNRKKTEFWYINFVRTLNFIEWTAFFCDVLPHERSSLERTEE